MSVVGHDHDDATARWGRVDGTADTRRICASCGKIQIETPSGDWVDEGQR